MAETSPVTKAPATYRLGTVDPEVIRNALGPQVLFVIERNIDEDLVVYEAELTADKRALKGVKIYWTKKSNLSYMDPVSDRSKDLFYDVKLSKCPKSKALYFMRVQCLQSASDKEHVIELHIKKSGRVVPKMVIGGHLCRLQKVYTDLSRAPPSVNGLWVEGEFNHETFSDEVQVDRSMFGQFITSFLSAKFF